jgi:hypothetical protein
MPLEDAADQNSLLAAHQALESSNWLIDLANLVGKPIELILKSLPGKANEIVEKTTTSALSSALKIALSTMDLKHRAGASPWWHRMAVTFTGGVGGVFGLPGLAVELPLSTTIMLRSIADIARAEGEDLQNAEACFACIEVFALGGHTAADDAADHGYFAVRAALGKTVSEAAAYVVERGAAEEAAPVIVRFVQKVAQRFAPAVADKAAAQAAPVVGAFGGAAVNLLFINHFQSVARGHFTVRRLERKYGRARVRQEYDLLKQSQS